MYDSQVLISEYNYFDEIISHKKKHLKNISSKHYMPLFKGGNTEWIKMAQTLVVEHGGRVTSEKSRKVATHKKSHLCSICKQKFTSLRSVDELAELISVCVNSVTACAKEIENCHTCGIKFLDFNESVEKIFAE